MTLDPVAERARVHEKYAPLRARDLGAFALAGVVLLVLDLWLGDDTNWAVYVGLAIGLVAWEIRKYQLRRNAERFAASSPSRSTV